MNEDTARKVTRALNEAGDLIESSQVADALQKHFPEWEWELWSDNSDSLEMQKQGWRSALADDEAWRVWEIVYRLATNAPTE